MAKAHRLLFLGFLSIIVFVILVPKASAEDSYFFRVDTELNVPLDTTGGATATWKCNGTGQGIVTDGTASESTNLLDGIIKVASTSAENASNRAGCDAGESITATLSFGGWVSRLLTDTVSTAGSNVTFTMRASLDYTIVINGVVDELSNALTLDGTTASATYSGTVASQSYSGGKRYIAGSTSGGTVKGGADGYVNRTSSALTISSAASQSVDFGTTDDSSLDENGLSFGHKITVTYGDNQASSAVSGTKVVNGIVTAGDSDGTNCTRGTGSNEGFWYCPVPLSHTATTATFRHDDLTSGTATYTDRTSGAGAQNTATITVKKKMVGGSGGVSFATPTPTLEPTPTPTVALMPTPEPITSPTPAPTVGRIKLYRKVNDPKVYVQGADNLLSWIKTLDDFNAAGYSWEDVQVISGSEFSLLKISQDSQPLAQLFRKANDPKVYVADENGTLTWVKTEAEFNAAGYNWSDVKIISGEEFGKMRVGGRLRVARGISFLRVRDGHSLGSKIIGQVSSGNEFDFVDTQQGWHKIVKDGREFGWVFGKYAPEI